MKWITVREFCKQYGISHQCVYKKIGRWGYKLGDHIKEEYGKSKQLDEEAVEYLRPKDRTVSPRKKADEEFRNALLSCERMCSENAGEIKALYDELREFKKRILSELRNVRTDMLRKASAENKQLSFSDNAHSNFSERSVGKDD